MNKNITLKPIMVALLFNFFTSWAIAQNSGALDLQADEYNRQVNLERMKNHELLSDKCSINFFKGQNPPSDESPKSTDTDNDGMPDSWESSNSLNPNDPKDAWDDPDADEVINLFEYQMGANPNNPGTPLTTNVSAGSNVETAIGMAPVRRLLRVQGGTYNVTYMTFSPRTVMIQGGWNSTFTVRDPEAYPTVFDGQQADAVLYFSPDTGTSNIILDGITLTNGTDAMGALAFINKGSSESNLCLKDCQIMNSQSTFDFGSAITINHWDSSSSEVFIVKCLIAGNGSSGIYSQIPDSSGWGKWHIINTTIANNISTDEDEGYGIRGFTMDPDANFSLELSNTIIWGNSKKGIYLSETIGTLDVISEYSDIDSVQCTGSYTQGSGVIAANPLFVNPTGDFHLTSGSPCINTGIDVGLPFTGTSPEMGVFEYEPSGRSHQENMSQNSLIYPNPATDHFFVENFPQCGSATICICDYQGKLLQTHFLNRDITKVDISKLDRGIYIVIITNEQDYRTMKLSKL